MKHITGRSAVIYAFVLAFFGGLIFLCYSLGAHSEEWMMNRVNQHIYKNGAISNAGTIYDVNGETLVSTKDTKRQYNSDATIRKTTLHVIGDSEGIISNGIQSLFHKELTACNTVNGVYNLLEYGGGGDITLCIDSSINKVAYEALNGKKGCVCVYNYKTGEIVCLVSAPTYDPLDVPDDLLTNEKYEGVYLNRCFSGLFVPGSTFKVMTAAIALETVPGIEDMTFTCKGATTIYGGTVKCSGYHGTQTFEEALNNSCNVAFAQIALKIGKENFQKGVEEAGLTTQITTDKIKVKASSFNVSDADDLGLGWAGVGQYTTLVTPYYMMTLMGAVANEGTPIKPYLVKSISNPSKEATEEDSDFIKWYRSSDIVDKIANLTAYKAKPEKMQQYFSKEVADRMKELMRSNVINYYGDSNFRNLQLCGKTGTAEVSDTEKPHAWFVGFSQREDFPYAFAVVVQNGGGSGRTVAAPIANKVLQALLKTVDK